MDNETSVNATTQGENIDTTATIKNDKTLAAGQASASQMGIARFKSAQEELKSAGGELTKDSAL